MPSSRWKSHVVKGTRLLCRFPGSHSQRFWFSRLGVTQQLAFLQTPQCFWGQWPSEYSEKQCIQNSTLPRKSASVQAWLTYPCWHKFAHWILHAYLMLIFSPPPTSSHLSPESLLDHELFLHSLPLPLVHARPWLWGFVYGMSAQLSPCWKWPPPQGNTVANISRRQTTPAIASSPWFGLSDQSDFFPGAQKPAALGKLNREQPCFLCVEETGLQINMMKSRKECGLNPWFQKLSGISHLPRCGYLACL